MASSNLSDSDISLLLSDILEVYGYDFTGYSFASLKRRVLKFYAQEGPVSYAEFRYQLRNEVACLKRFIEHVTVNVTEMFRDAEFYRTLKSEVLPALGTYPFIRIWVAGCSTGEEAYSIAIALQEAGLLKKSLVYATDINAAVLEKAAQAILPLSKMKQYSENYIAAGGTGNFSDYYTANYSLAKLHEALRSRIVFSTHNLVSETSFNEFQLILCRNVLIYFERSLQVKVFGLFDSSLVKLGYLALGTKETLEFSAMATKYKKSSHGKIWKKIAQ